jgi:hypothetical protein
MDTYVRGGGGSDWFISHSFEQRHLPSIHSEVEQKSHEELQQKKKLHTCTKECTKNPRKKIIDAILSSSTPMPPFPGKWQHSTNTA